MGETTSGDLAELATLVHKCLQAIVDALDETDAVLPEGIDADLDRIRLLASLLIP